MTLAAAQPVSTSPQAVASLHARLGDNAAVLLSAYRASAAEIESGHAVVPAAEWLLDNYHIVESPDPRGPRRPPTRLLPAAAEAR